MQTLLPLRTPTPLPRGPSGVGRAARVGVLRRPLPCAATPPAGSSSSTAVAASPSSSPPASTTTTTTTPAAQRAEATVRAFYTAWNAGDAAGAAATLADDVSYWDTIYDTPFQGRDAVQAYLSKALTVLGPDVAFVVDAVAPSPDGACVGVKWHCELKDGRHTPLPNSRGASFYELDAEGRIVRARDLVEPAIKPGASTLAVLRLVLPLVKLMGDGGGKAAGGGGDTAPAATSTPSLTLTPAATAVWLLYLGYFSLVFFSRALPGVPVFETPPDVLREVFDESINFFYVNPLLHALHLSPFGDPARPPPSEALFNFVNAWSALFLPAMLADTKAAPLGRKNVIGLWFGIQFLTNVFFPPYLALRLMTESGEEEDKDGNTNTLAIKPTALPSWTPTLVAVCTAVAAISPLWALFARPEFGDLAARADATTAMLTTNRATFAFALDSCLYAVWQAALLDGAPARYRFVPLFGLAAWLWEGGGEEK